MGKIENENPLGLKWTWYLFLAANIFVVLGVAIAWIWKHNRIDANPSAVYSVIIVFNILAIITVGLFYFLDLKDMILIKQHLKKSTLMIYFLAGFVVIAAVLFSFLYNMFVLNIAAQLSGGSAGNSESFNITYIIEFAIVCTITLIAVAMYRYAKYKIDLTIFRRRRGEETAATSEPPKEVPPASSNLIDHVDK